MELSLSDGAKEKANTHSPLSAAMWSATASSTGKALEDLKFNFWLNLRGDHGYGFAEPYNIYARCYLIHLDLLLSFPLFNNSLSDLVLHYAVNSLEEHNDR